MKTVTYIRTHKKEILHRYRFLFVLKKCMRELFHYMICISRPAKKLTPEGKKKAKEVTADDDNQNSFSPIFTNTKDATDWLNA